MAAHLAWKRSIARGTRLRRTFASGMAILAIGGLAGPAAATTYGSLGNFDAVNDTGKTAHGFEIDLEGISVSDVTDVFGGVGRYFPPTVERYGAPTIMSNAGGTGVIVRYEATFNNTTSSWDVGTPFGSISHGWRKLLDRRGRRLWAGHAVRSFRRRHQDDADQHDLQLADRDRGEFADAEQCHSGPADAGAGRDASTPAASGTAGRAAECSGAACRAAPGGSIIRGRRMGESLYDRVRPSGRAGGSCRQQRNRAAEPRRDGGRVAAPASRQHRQRRQP